MDNVGLRIKVRRQELGLTQSELAKKMGYSGKSAISKVEVNDEDMSMARVKKFAEALDCSVAYLMGWESPDFYITPPVNAELEHIIKKLNPEQSNRLLTVALAMFPEVR